MSLLKRLFRQWEHRDASRLTLLTGVFLSALAAITIAVIAVAPPAGGFPPVFNVFNTSFRDGGFLNDGRAAAWLFAAVALICLFALAGSLTLLYRLYREQENAARQALEMKARTEAAKHAKARFLSKVSHEVRTPMNGIMGMTELLLEMKLDTEQRRCATIVYHSSKNLLKIIDNILDLSRLEAGLDGLDSGPDIDRQAVRPESALPPWRRHLIPKILVVEDGEINRQLMQILLTRMGCDFDFAMNGSEALEAIEKCGYDLVLMDCMMPVMDGYNAVRLIRAREVEKDAVRLRIIALTANTMDDEFNRCLAAGMDGYLAKPFTGTEFTEMVQYWLAQGKSSGNPMQAASP